MDASLESISSDLTPPTEKTDTASQLSTPVLPEEGHQTYLENQKGISFEGLFGDYIYDAKKVEIQDPYIRTFHQTRNIMELIELLVILKDPADSVEVDLVTGRCEFNPQKQDEFLGQIQVAAAEANIQFSWRFDDLIHARHIQTDTGWKITLDRGLDIFQRYEMNNSFSLSNRLQEQRQVKQFEVTYIKV